MSKFNVQLFCLIVAVESMHLQQVLDTYCIKLVLMMLKQAQMVDNMHPTCTHIEA